MPRLIAARDGRVDLGRFGAWMFRGDAFLPGEQLVRKLEHRVRRHGVEVHVTLRKVDGHVVGVISRPVEHGDRRRAGGPVDVAPAPGHHRGTS
ncbi:hypothetical protein ASD11_14160 [Aeromicrobium sp. Root495]|nr:hypothetical protein ASD11_14160 [Aeromicrobium sp. Root495]